MTDAPLPGTWVLPGVDDGHPERFAMVRPLDVRWPYRHLFPLLVAILIVGTTFLLSIPESGPVELEHALLALIVATVVFRQLAASGMGVGSRGVKVVGLWTRVVPWADIDRFELRPEGGRFPRDQLCVVRHDGSSERVGISVAKWGPSVHTDARAAAGDASVPELIGNLNDLLRRRQQADGPPT